MVEVGFDHAAVGDAERWVFDDGAVDQFADFVVRGYTFEEGRDGFRF